MPSTWEALVTAARAHLAERQQLHKLLDLDIEEVKVITDMVDDLEHQLRSELDYRPLVRTRHEWSIREILEREG